MKERRNRPGMSRTRLLCFGLIASFCFFAAGNLVVEWLEQGGLVETHRPDDYVQFLDEPLFERQGDWFVTTDYASRFLVPGKFRVDKGDRFRVFLLGASFSMGTPYASQGDRVERPGGIATWLREDLNVRFGADGYEVINAAAGAQTSHRVRRIAEEILQFQPDLIIVGSCNNEGPPKPDYVREQLHQLGSYRLLARLLAPPVPDDERPHFTPQLLGAEEVRDEFRENIEAIVAAASKRGVAVALMTLPVNLRYAGDGAPLPPGDEEGAHRAAECVTDGKNLFLDGEYEAAIAALAACEDVPDAARWSGLALEAVGQPERAREALQLSVELLPRNRCRPSLNAVTRSIAEVHPAVLLADLEVAAERMSPSGLPGENLFVDYCHLNWRGYAAMNEVVVRELELAQLIPVAPEGSWNLERRAEELGVSSEY